jgi:predicted transcriptional regulator of viral defense system
VPPLAARETELLAELERQRRSVITLKELSTRFGRTSAYGLVRSMVHKGLLNRLGSGIYLARPVRSLGRAWVTSGPVIATYLLAEEPHYQGGRWAWTFYGLTRQMHASRIDAFVTHWRSTRKLENTRIFFHQTPEDNFGYGIQSVNIEGASVRLSDLERTLLDALDYPSLLGSIADAVQRVADVLQKARVNRIISHAVRGSRPSTCQRLAVLLERKGVSARTLSPLLSRTRETASVLSLWPDRLRRGRLNNKWRVVENDKAPSR